MKLEIGESLCYSITEEPPARLQLIVQPLMATLLEEHPPLLDATTIHKLMDPDHCKNVLGINITNHSLLRVVEDGREISGHPRYYTKKYAGKFYVCKEWWAPHHANAESLRKFALAIAQNNPDNPGIPALNNHIKALSDCAKS